MDISLITIKRSITTFLKRYHIVLFVVIVLGGLGSAVLLLNNTVNLSGESNGYISTANSTSFDQATINRINQLKSPDQNNSALDLTKGRTNPFVE